MQKVIYIDSIFFLNLIMDLFLLELTAVTLKKTATFFRILLGSLIGAAGYCLILCIPEISYFCKTLLGMIPMTFLMVRIGCQTKKWKEIFYGTGYLFAYAFLLGGFLLFLIKRIPFLKARSDSVFLILIVGYIGFRICRFGIRKYQKSRKNHFCMVELLGDEQPIRIYGLIDTGNGLTEPISGKPVAILEEAIWQEMKKSKRPEKYRIIPFHSIGKENGILEGYEVERVQIEYETQRKELTNVPVAVFKGKLSVKGEYQMILPTQWSF